MAHAAYASTPGLLILSTVPWQLTGGLCDQWNYLLHFHCLYGTVECGFYYILTVVFVLSAQTQARSSKSANGDLEPKSESNTTGRPVGGLAGDNSKELNIA